MDINETLQGHLFIDNNTATSVKDRYELAQMTAVVCGHYHRAALLKEYIEELSHNRA